jgi:hypothetical protein
MHSYCCYGLGVSSEIALPELSPFEGPAEVVIRRGVLADLSSLQFAPNGTFISIDSCGSLLAWKGVGAFQVRDASEILFEPAPDAEDRSIRTFLLGPVLATLLRYKGRLVLHGSGIEIAGNGVLFLGGPGWGKSTLAAAFHSRGYRVVTDDVAPIAISDAGRPTLFAGFPQLRLWPQTIEFLGEDLDGLARLDPREEKRARPIENGFAQAALPLGRIYVLARGESAKVDLLSASEAVAELTRHSFGAVELQKVNRASHFLQCASGECPLRCWN